MQVLTKIPLKIQTVLICTLKPFPKFNEIQNLSLDRRQGNKEKYLPLGRAKVMAWENFMYIYACII